MSSDDRQRLAKSNRLTNIEALPRNSNSEEEDKIDDYAREFGYDDEDLSDPQVVVLKRPCRLTLSLTWTLYSVELRVRSIKYHDCVVKPFKG